MLEPVLDVVIVGAGFSGLAAAEKIVSANKSTVVVEARERVGGKVCDPQFRAEGGSQWVETGASYHGPGQTAVADYIKRFDLKTFQTYEHGQTIFKLRGGERGFFDPLNPEFAAPPISSEALMELLSATTELDSMARQLDIAAPWSHPKAVEWDTKTLQTWIESNFSNDDAIDAHTLTWRSLLSAEPADVSLLQALTYVARATDGESKGNWTRLTSVRGGAQERRIEGGSSRIAIELAKRLGDNVIRLNSPVQGISAKDNMYEVYIERELGQPKEVLRARSIVLALSPPLINRIKFEPPLPAQRDLMTQRMFMGSLGKVIAIYDKPFWREEGSNGHAVGFRDATVQLTYDGSPSDGSYGVIMGFIVGKGARELDELDDEEVQKLALRDYTSYFGPRAAEVKRWVIHRWNNEEFSRGGHLALSPPNFMTVYGASLDMPVGNIMFAGTELSDRWAGFMEGAIIAGRKAADAAIAKLC